MHTSFKVRYWLRRLNFEFSISQIIIRYDIILIQEIRDSSGAAIVQLLNLVNE